MSIYKNVHKSSFWYLALKFLVYIPHNYFFYRKHIITGLENVPENEPVLFVPNHQNALMDALAMVCSKYNWQTVFLARADIFKNPLVSKILVFLKILPVYRMRDGVENLKSNDETFMFSVDVFNDRKSLTIFPEASHLGFRRLRQLQKGAVRLAFQAEEQAQFKLGLKIIPVGIHYTNYYHSRATVITNYGKPVEFADLFDLYKENQAKAYNMLRERMTKVMSEMIIDIKPEIHYDAIDLLRDIYDKPMAVKMGVKSFNQLNKFKVQKAIASKLSDYFIKNPVEAKILEENTGKYGKLLSENNLRDWVIEKPKSGIKLVLSWILMIVGLPLFASGLILNYIPHIIPSFILKKIKDRNFHTSFQFVLYILAFPIYYFLLLAILALITKIGLYELGFFVLLPFLYVFALDYRFWFVKLCASTGYFFMSNEKRNEIKDLRNKIVDNLTKIL